MAKRPPDQRPAGYVTNSRRKLAIGKRIHSACVVFKHCEAMRLRICVCGLVKQTWAHIPNLLCISSFMKCLPLHTNYQHAIKRQSYHSFIPRASIFNSLIHSLALIDYSLLGPRVPASSSGVVVDRPNGFKQRTSGKWMALRRYFACDVSEQIALRKKEIQEEPSLDFVLDLMLSESAGVDEVS